MLAPSIDETGPSLKRQNRGIPDPKVLMKELISPAVEERIRPHVQACNRGNPAIPDGWNDQKDLVGQICGL